MSTLLRRGQAWVSNANGRVLIVESAYPNSMWKVRRADGATDVLPEALIYREFTPFNPSGLSANDKDGNPVKFVAGPNAVPPGGDA